MSLDVYLRLRAAKARRAQPRAARRHAHLSARPLAVVGYHLAGEPGAPVALRYGTAPDNARTLVVPEPRDRTLRFERLAEFGADLARYLAHFAGRVETDKGAVCVDAPQLLVPNPTTAQWLTDLLGRSLRFRDEPALATTGAHLTFFGTRRDIPGSSLVVAATDLLTTHWVTGQLPVEDANLATVLAWIDPPPGRDGVEAAEEAEELPPAGPVSDPQWDRHTLRPLVAEYGRARGTGVGEAPAAAELAAAVDAQLEPAWRAVWAARDLVALLPEAAHVGVRWDDDRREWTRHLDRVAADAAHFARRMDQLRSYRFLHELERRTLKLARQMALDDPLLLAAQVAAGDALAGEVVERDCAHRITLPTGRKGLRPLLRLRPAVSFDRPLGTELCWSENQGVQVTVTEVDADGMVTLMVVKGACQSPAKAEEILPAPGEPMTLVALDDTWYPDTLPEELPWTHQPTEVTL